MTTLTCITTTFNDGVALEVSLPSILSQSFGDFEYIIVDDGSSDDTNERLSRIEDPRVRVIRQANDGLSSARNTALAQARGDYVCFLDADDSRPAWAFGAIARVIDRHAPDMVLCRGVLSEMRGDPMAFYDTSRFSAISALCPEGVVTPRHPEAAAVWALAQGIEPQSANKVVRRALLREHRLRFPDTHFFEDILFHTGALAAAERLAFVQTPCFTYFRRYLRPQITSTASDLRFDSIAVTKLTLEGFARRPQMHEPAYRTAVLASCMRILDWCGASIGHAHKRAFSEARAGMLRMIDPLYLHLPDRMPEGTVDLDALRHTLEVVTHAA